MARGDQLSRQWRLLQMLLMSRNGRSAAELAAELGCHARTVYRDLTALQQAGFPLYTPETGGTRRWALLDTPHAAGPGPISIREVAALSLARSLLQPLPDSGLHGALTSLYDKLRAGLPPRAARYLDAMRTAVSVRSSTVATPARDHLLTQIRRAVIERRRVEIDYWAASRQQHTRRTIDPYRIWVADGLFYLIAYCHLRADVRIFAADRIHQLKLTDHHFAEPEHFDADAFMAPGLGAYTGPPQRITIRFTPAAAAYLLLRTWHPSQQTSTQPDGSVIFSAQLAVTAELCQWVLRWGSAAEVLEPDTLRQQIRIQARSLAALYAATR